MAPLHRRLLVISLKQENPMRYLQKRSPARPGQRPQKNQQSMLEQNAESQSDGISPAWHGHLLLWHWYAGGADAWHFRTLQLPHKTTPHSHKNPTAVICLFQGVHKEPPARSRFSSRGCAARRWRKFLCPFLTRRSRFCGENPGWHTKA